MMNTVHRVTQLCMLIAFGKHVKYMAVHHVFDPGKREDSDEEGPRN